MEERTTKIFFVTSDLDRGGTARHVSMIANALAEKGYTIEILVYSRPNAENYFTLNTRIRCRFFSLEILNSDFRRMHAMRKIIHEARPDIIVSWLADINVRVLLATWGLTIPVIVHEVSHPVNLPLSKLSRLLRLMLYPFVSLLLLQTKEAGRFFPFWLRKKIRVIPNPIRIPEEMLVQRNKTIISAGRLSLEKNFGLLLSAFSLVKRYHPDWSLNIWGDGPERDHLDVHARKEGLNPSDIFKGSSATPDAWQSTGQIFSMCSHYEGFPNALAEAMAAGYPVAVTPFSCGPHDMIESGREGLIASMPTAESLAKALCELIEDANKSEGFGKNARQKAQNGWNVAHVTSMWKAMIDDVKLL